MVVAVVNMGVLGPLVHGRAEVAVVRQPAGDDQFATARSSGYRGGAGVALQRVRRVKLLDVVTDFAGDAGGEAIPEAGEAEVDFIARDRFSRVGIPGLVGAALAAIAQQELTHAAHPVPPGLAQGQQLGRGERDGGGLSPDQVVAHRQLLGGQGVKDTHREPARPAMARGAREAFKGIFAGLRFGRNAVSRLSFKEPSDNSQQGSVPAVWGSVLVLALLAAVDPVRLGLTLLLISRPRPVQNLLAYGVGSPDSVYSHIGGSADAAARHTNV